MKKAIIVGCNGQDGKLLNSYLLKKDYKIVGIGKNITVCSDGFLIGPVDIKNSQEVFQLIKELKPNEIYYLAAFHHSSEANSIDNIDLFQQSFDVHVSALVNFLEGIKQYSSQTRIFYAASSHIFGEPGSEIQNEVTAINPNCFYGITKAAGLFLCRLYRNNYSIFASTGILYNHESSFRSEAFISKKIIISAINIKRKKQEKLTIGDLNAEIDWGYAPDYIDAMYRIINCEEPQDFIVATGEKHKVLDFVKTTFEYLDLDWRRYVEEDRSIITKKNYCRIGNPKKLMDKTGWKPSVDFREMIKLLLTESYK
ncbi:MAG: GDP-mannose 4,6-dehydratase [Proteobacteria bacterium]|nr:GDP-mannose 4,6-dehydratase [Pseudomonadota bacterium]